MPTAQTQDLGIAYEVDSPRNGPPVLLMHGWPDDSSTWDHVGHSLRDAGFLMIVPSLRRFGETRFRAETVPRTGNSGIHAMDMIALMDGLGIERFAVAGHDLFDEGREHVR